MSQNTTATTSTPTSSTSPQAERKRGMPGEERTKTPSPIEIEGVSLENIDMNKLILVSSAKRAATYVSTAKRWLQEYETVYLSGLGNAMSTVVKITEILKSTGLITVEKIATGTTTPGQGGFEKRKAVLWVTMKRSTNFHQIIQQQQQQTATTSPASNNQASSEKH